MRSTAFAVFAALVLAPATSFAQDDTHPFSIHDMLAMQRVGDAQVSPDGAQVLFNLRTTDLEADRGRTDIWIAAVDGSGTRQLTTHEASDWNARWMPDGSSIVFLSTRSGSAQAWTLDLAGGEASQLTDFDDGIGNLHVFPDGERLLFTMEVDVTPAAVADEESDGDDLPKSSAQVYTDLLFRHWDTWEDHLRTHVFAWEIGGGDPVDLMAGMDTDSPTKPFGGGEELAISPDGTEVAFAAKHVGREAAWSTNVDIFTVPADGSAQPVNVTDDNEAWDTGPSYSPDGQWLGYEAMARPGFEADRFRIVLRDRESGQRRVLTEDWDRSAGGLAWSQDSLTIWTSASDLGNRSIFAVDVPSGEVTRLLSSGYNTSPSQAGGRLLFAHDDLASPVELFTAARDGSDVQPVTRVNAERVAAARTGEYEQFSFAGWNGETVYGWVTKPADYVEGQQYPVAFLIHGGPQGSFGNHFHYRWNPQAYAGAGYATVFIDFHGSTGYGQAFTDSISGDWGGKPYEDLMLGLDYALENYAFLDGSRVGALGASYGGYMINWIAGQTDRFRCLVNHDGVFDNRSMYYETEELWFPEWEHGGPEFANPEGFAKHDPVAHVDNWKTPMLVIHGALDFRVPETQGFGAFTALQRKGVPSKLLYFPDENHWVLKPANSIAWHEHVLAWLEEWTTTGS